MLQLGAAQITWVVDSRPAALPADPDMPTRLNASMEVSSTSAPDLGCIVRQGVQSLPAEGVSAN